jgi:hypothetical protein
MRREHYIDGICRAIHHATATVPTLVLASRIWIFLPHLVNVFRADINANSATHASAIIDLYAHGNPLDISAFPSVYCRYVLLVSLIWPYRHL